MLDTWLLSACLPQSQASRQSSLLSHVWGSGGAGGGVRTGQQLGAVGPEYADGVRQALVLVEFTNDIAERAAAGSGAHWKHPAFTPMAARQSQLMLGIL